MSFKAYHPSEGYEAARRWTVLVVEDDVLVRSMIAEALRDDGHLVIEAANAAEAVIVFKAGEAVDLVFTDRQMPGEMDGLMLARWIHEHHARVPVLLTSGNGSRVGMADFVLSESFFPKPYQLEEVAARVRLLLGKPGARGD
ncbi:MAG TPA: response regulator [Aliidongia sp.]|nr:response regulator [Aliidongia sp.]